MFKAGTLGHEGNLDTVFADTVAGIPDKNVMLGFNKTVDDMLSDSGICTAISATQHHFW